MDRLLSGVFLRVEQFALRSNLTSRCCGLGRCLGTDVARGGRIFDTLLSLVNFVEAPGVGGLPIRDTLASLPGVDGRACGIGEA